jgi:hypothetical protein
MRATQLGSARYGSFTQRYLTQENGKRHLGGPHSRAMTILFAMPADHDPAYQPKLAPTQFR